MITFFIVSISVMALPAIDCARAPIYMVQAHAAQETRTRLDAAPAYAPAGQFTPVSMPGNAVRSEPSADLHSYMWFHSQATESGGGMSLTPWLQLRSLGEPIPDLANESDELTHSPRTGTSNECS